MRLRALSLLLVVYLSSCGQSQRPAKKTDQPQASQSTSNIDFWFIPVSPDKNPTNKQDAPNDKSDYGDLATWALVFVGIGGTIAALKTLVAIKRQVTLQAASMTQWISVENWRTVLDQKTRTLFIDFAVTNESPFPLGMQAKFKFLGLLPNSATLTQGDLPLFPKKPHDLKIRLHLTEDQVDDILTGEYRIAVHGQIINIGVAKEYSPLMTIRGNLLIGKNIPTPQPQLELQSIRLYSTEPPKGFLRRICRRLGIFKSKDNKQGEND